MLRRIWGRRVYATLQFQRKRRKYMLPYLRARIEGRFWYARAYRQFISDTVEKELFYIIGCGTDRDCELGAAGLDSRQVGFVC